LKTPCPGRKYNELFMTFDRAKGYENDDGDSENDNQNEVSSDNDD